MDYPLPINKLYRLATVEVMSSRKERRTVVNHEGVVLANDSCLSRIGVFKNDASAIQNSGRLHEYDSATRDVKNQS